MMGYNWNWGFDGFFGMAIMAIFWVGIIVLAIWLVTKIFNNSGAAMANRSTPTNVPPTPLAIEILKQRYARGEITKEQFEVMRSGIDA